MRKLLLLGFSLLNCLISVKAEVRSLQPVKYSLAAKIVDNYKAGRLKLDSYYSSATYSGKFTGDILSNDKRFLQSAVTESSIGILPTKSRVEDTMENFLLTCEYEYDEYGNITLMAQYDEYGNGTWEYIEWLTLPNGKLVRTKEGIEERDGGRVEIDEMITTYSQDGIIMGIHVRNGKGLVGEPESIVWEDEENWVIETNAEGIRTGINGFTTLSEIIFDEKGRVVTLKLEEDDEIYEYTYVWEDDKLISYALKYSDDEVTGSESYTDIEIVYNAHLFDPYAMIPHAQLIGDGIETLDGVIYYNASGGMREGLYATELQMKGIIDEEKGEYQQCVYVIERDEEKLWQQIKVQRVDEYGGHELSINYYVNPGSGRPILLSYYLQEYNEDGNIKNEIAGGYNAFAKKETIYEGKRAIKNNLYQGNSTSRFTSYGVEYFTEWQDGYVNKICGNTISDNVNLYLVDGNLYIESQEAISSLIIYSMEGNIVAIYQNVNSAISLPAGISIIRIDTEKRYLIEKIIK